MEGHARAAAPAASPTTSPTAVRQDSQRDGLRGLAWTAGDGKVRLRSRTGADLTVLFPELQVGGMPAGPPVLLDGEVVVADRAGRPDFEQVARRLGCSPARVAQLARAAPATFVAFDLLHVGDRSMLNLSYADRRAALEQLRLHGDQWAVSPLYSSGAALLTATAAQRLEGVVAKRWDSRYRPGRRSPAWIKAKHWQRVD